MNDTILVPKNEILLRTLLAIVFTNSAGLLLNFFNLDDYIILLGFRFKLNLIFPLLFFINAGIIENIKKSFIYSAKNKFLQQLFIIVLPSVILVAALYFINKVDLGDPEYFYEFGLSSIFDFPIYLLWNLPQLLIFIALLKFITDNLPLKLLLTPLFIILFFAYEALPAGAGALSYKTIFFILQSSITLGMIISNFKNLFTCSFMVFFMLWSYFLFWGTGSKEIVNLLFAHRYNSWEGLLWIDDKIYPFISYIYFGITFLAILPFSFAQNKKA